MDEDQMNSDYVFFFVGGTCGSFVKTIFHYYLHKLDPRFPQATLHFNKTTGDCHINNVTFKNVHYIDQLDLSKKIVLIDFDKDDVPCIIRMAFHKVVKNQMSKDPLFLKTQWNNPELVRCQHNNEALEKIFLENPNYLIFADWREQVKRINPVLVIKFKDIMFGNLNSIIANFFQVECLPEVDVFVDAYRQANQKYLTIS